MKRNFKLLIYLLGFVQRTSAKFLPVSLLLAIVQGLSPLITVIVPKLIIDELLGTQDIRTLALLIALLAGAKLLLKSLETVLNRVRDNDLEYIQLKVAQNLADKSIHLRYEDVEKKSILDLKERAFTGMYNFYELIDNIGIASKSLITLVSLVVILFRFNGWVVPILAGLTLTNTFVYRKINNLRYRDSMITIPANRGFSYFGRLASDFAYGKDIRLSHCAKFLQTKARTYLDKVLEVFSKQYTEIGTLQGITGINVMFQSFLVYGWLAWSAVRSLLSIGDFTMYGSAARQFTQTFSAFVNSLISINGLCLHIEPYQEFDSLPESAEIKSQTAPFSINKDEPLTFRFDHVWFRYPDTDRDVLKDINIEIGQQEKLSIVGLNGAGKTTFIKLFCRLYQPTKGAITLNGRDINDIPLDDYLRFLSVVFQDFQLLGYAIDMNIAASEDPDQTRIDHTIKFFGIGEILKKLPKGLQTSIYRALDKEGVAFSGGQAQKFAIARALYKDAPVTILDEPTSALDPRSEYDVYLNFNQLATGKTAIYISHRLSSTRFTDRIAVFQDGQIVELGTHDDLMTNDGLYQEMYTKQASYYQ